MIMIYPAILMINHDNYGSHTYYIYNGNHYSMHQGFSMALSGHNFALELDLCIGGAFFGALLMSFDGNDYSIMSISNILRDIKNMGYIHIYISSISLSICIYTHTRYSDRLEAAN